MVNNIFLDWKSLIPADFQSDSRVWIYQASRLFHISEALQIEGILEDFVTHWKSHGTPVKGYANLLFGQFVIFMADESATGVSGCSTDSSVRVVKEIEKLFKVPMFDRQTLAFIKNEKVELIPMNQFSYALEHGLINPDTLFFNNLASNKAALLNDWLLPVKTSWLSKRFPLLNSDFC